MELWDANTTDVEYKEHDISCAKSRCFGDLNRWLPWNVQDTYLLFRSTCVFLHCLRDQRALTLSHFYLTSNCVCKKYSSLSLFAFWHKTQLVEPAASLSRFHRTRTNCTDWSVKEYWKISSGTWGGHLEILISKFAEEGSTWRALLVML